MQAIRQFQEERASWEAEREELLARCQQEETARREAQHRASVLEEEVAGFKDPSHHHSRSHSQSQNGNLSEVAGTTAQTAVAGAAVLSANAASIAELKRTHALKQLALMDTIDSLRRDLQEEQRKSDLRKAELDETRGGARGGSNSSSGSCTLAEAGYLTQLRKLEDENLSLRNELNAEKRKVVELKRTAQARVAKWKAEMQTVEAELEGKMQLEEELARLRIDYDRVVARETKSNTELVRLRSSPGLEGSIAAAPALEKKAPPPDQNRPELAELRQVLDIFFGQVRKVLPRLLEASGRLQQQETRDHHQHHYLHHENFFEGPRRMSAHSNDIRASLRTILESLEFLLEVMDGRERDLATRRLTQEDASLQTGALDTSQVVGAWFKNVFA